MGDVAAHLYAGGSNLVERRDVKMQETEMGWGASAVLVLEILKRQEWIHK